jgi:hypothetical protein
MDDPRDALESAVAQIDDRGHGKKLEPPRRLAMGQGFCAARRAGAVNAELFVLQLLIALFTPGHAAPFERNRGVPKASDQGW